MLMISKHNNPNKREILLLTIANIYHVLKFGRIISQNIDDLFNPNQLSYSDKEILSYVYEKLGLFDMWELKDIIKKIKRILTNRRYIHESII